MISALLITFDLLIDLVNTVLFGKKYFTPDRFPMFKLLNKEYVIMKTWCGNLGPVQVWSPNLQWCRVWGGLDVWDL